jgi:hypothetical protein
MALPLLLGAEKLTLAPVAPDRVALTAVGALGTPQVVILPLALLALPVPTLLVAVTVNV